MFATAYACRSIRAERLTDRAGEGAALRVLERERERKKEKTRDCQEERCVSLLCYCFAWPWQWLRAKPRAGLPLASQMRCVAAALEAAARGAGGGPGLRA